MLVGEGDTFEAVHSRIEDVPIHGKAVGSSRVVRRYCASKPVKLNLLVGIVELQDRTDTLDSLEILVFGWIEEVEGVAVSWVSV